MTSLLEQEGFPVDAWNRYQQHNLEINERLILRQRAKNLRTKLYALADENILHIELKHEKHLIDRRLKVLNKSIKQYDDDCKSSTKVTIYTLDEWRMPIIPGHTLSLAELSESKNT